MKRLSVHQLTLCAIIAALYAAVTICTASISYGPIQFRLAEALCVLPYFAPWTAWGLGLGCLLANLFSTVTALDLVIGTCATVAGCALTARIRCRWLVPLPTVFCNALLVGAMLALVSTPEAPLRGFLLYGAQVGLGELTVLYLLGLPLLLALEKSGLAERIQRLSGKDAP